MRLLIVSSEFPPGPGGIGTHAYQVGRHLRPRGWDVCVLTSQNYAPEEEIAAFNRSQPFSVIRLRDIPGPPREALFRRRVLTRVLGQFQPEILLATGSRAVMVTAMLPRRRLPWIAIGHGTEFQVRPLWEQSLTRWAYRRATAIVCVSRYTWSQMMAFGIEPRMGEIIPNGADAERFVPLPGGTVAEARRDLGLPDGPLLLTVGQVSDRKGQEVVIRALPEIVKRFPKIRYVMAGWPAKKEKLVSLSRELGVEEHVRFLGRVEPDRLVPLINCCDVFVMTSRHTSDGDFEGYGIAVVEAALCGKPAVVSAGSGLSEAIEEAVTGLTVPENDPRATASALLTLLESDERRERMGRVARERALAEQTWDRRVSQYEELLGRLVRVWKSPVSARTAAASSSIEQL